jgi:hypothetical protein
MSHAVALLTASVLAPASAVMVAAAPASAAAPARQQSAAALGCRTSALTDVVDRCRRPYGTGVG